MNRRLPVQRLSANAAEAFAAHLHVLDPEDVRLRFGVPRNRTAIDACVALFDYALRSNVEAMRRVGTAFAGAQRS